MLGRRKRRGEISDLHDERTLFSKDDTAESMQILFRQHFESNFEPLKGVLQTSKVEGTKTPAQDVASDLDWNGCSEDGEDAVEVVQGCVSPSFKAAALREGSMEFMVQDAIFKMLTSPTWLTTVEFKTSKPPLSPSKRVIPTPKPSREPEASRDASNLRKDLALQHLLKESHLLDADCSLLHVGQKRHKASDLRLQDAGCKSSIFTQKKMPLAQRKGIGAKFAEREEQRRRQAQENGVVLEKISKSKRKKTVNRQRGIGAPSVGKFQRGGLKLSQKDIKVIEGPQRTLRRHK